MTGAIALAAGACATKTTEPSKDAAASYLEDPRLGDKVDRICFASQINGFGFVDEYQDAVLIEARVNDWFFVELMGPCTVSGLRFAQTVALDFRRGGGCLTRGDRLVFSDSLSFGPARTANLRRCTMGSVYRWDRNAGEAVPAGEEGADGPQ